VDSSHEAMMLRFPAEAALALENGQKAFFSGCRFLYPLGAARLRPASRRPEQAAEHALAAHTKTCHAMSAEYAALPAVLAHGQSLPGLGSLPLVVLSREKSSGEARGGLPGVSAQQMAVMNAVWDDLQLELAALSTRGVQRHVQGGGHMIQVTRPQAVVDAVREVLGADR
jgi:pimeloyl-ACP methyl ester carboxylesterase